MPSTVRCAFAAAGLEPNGCVRWGQRVEEAGPGVYVIALTEQTDSFGGLFPEGPIARDRVSELLKVRPELRVDQRRPNESELTSRVRQFWLADEVILYIGLAGSSVRTRVSQYYRTPLGARKPHAGGWPLKLVANIGELFVHYAASSDPGRSEDRMLARFCGAVSEGTRSRVLDPERPFPFANLEWPRGVRKRHGITGATGT
jgi:hypothetical protein